MTTMHTIGEVSRLVGIPRSRLAYLIEAGQLPGPAIHVPGRRLFDETEIEQIKSLLEKNPRLRNGRVKSGKSKPMTDEVVERS